MTSIPDIAIRTVDLGKRYRLRQVHGRDAAFGLLSRLFGRAVSGDRPDEDGRRAQGGWFWALRGLNLEVAHGEALGIVGANGAGKSTLLKLLSRITAPTNGYAEVYGRVGCLLEVGTGFNWELTGRENVYLNGTILGMSRHEIMRKFDEIVEFSGTGDFIDVPVKRYSSGMVTRLGFAVAAHLDPEILIVDEVLAVGDAAFQRKCIDKMREVSRREGRTVLFVSHSAESVLSLCTRAIWLEDGRLRLAGPTREIVQSYLASMTADGVADSDLLTRADREGTGELRVIQVNTHTGPEAPRSQAVVGEPMNIDVSYTTSHDKLRAVEITIRIVDRRSVVACVLSTQLLGRGFDPVSGLGRIRCRVERCPLAPGPYWLDVTATSGSTVLDQITRAAPFDVLAGRYHPDGLVLSTEGVVYVDHEWLYPVPESASICEGAHSKRPHAPTASDLMA